MKKLENFHNCLQILRDADFSHAGEDEIYRTGVVGQFQLTFELAWKALQEMLREHSVLGAETGSPREILKMAYKTGWICDADEWLLMQKKRNLSVHLYNEEEIDRLVVLIRDRFIPAFEALERTLKKLEEEAKEDRWDG